MALRDLPERSRPGSSRYVPYNFCLLGRFFGGQKAHTHTEKEDQGKTIPQIAPPKTTTSLYTTGTTRMDTMNKFSFETVFQMPSHFG